MNKARLATSALLGLAAAFGARAGARFFNGLGDLCQESELGYSSANSLPIAGQPGFPDTSGIGPADVKIPFQPCGAK
ncbi:hypothetical protein [Mycolicibacterium sp. 050158]|uniref:hypothetical protein n=1 Tax=Mycolicibacterium sp. 050158 TaxID=3090602 RepID=UPI00299F191A|nr:hypothetical protein [Mycolicibacterium sp. 050158]MDX1888188.1 hypothetical protein [Mycolicibacterium sp. 050158]